MTIEYFKMLKLLGVITVLALTGSNAGHSISKRSVEELTESEILIIKQALRYINGDSTIYGDLQTLADLGVELITAMANEKTCAADIKSQLLAYGEEFIQNYLDCVGPAVNEINTQTYAVLDERIENEHIPRLDECTAESMLECLSDSLDGLEAANDKLLELLGNAGLALIKLMALMTECSVTILFEDAATVAILMAEAHHCTDPPITA